MIKIRSPHHTQNILRRWNIWPLLVAGSLAFNARADSAQPFHFIPGDAAPRTEDQFTPYQPMPSLKPADRFGWSADGNTVDPDDWSATPIALVTFAAIGYQDRLVHFSYNNRLDRNVPFKALQNKINTLGTAERYGFDLSTFYDLWYSSDATLDLKKNKPGYSASGVFPEYDAALQSAVDEIKASHADSRFFWIQAGPFEFAYRALKEAVAQGATRDQLKHVILVSHSEVNERELKWSEPTSKPKAERERFAAGAKTCVEEFGVGFLWTGAQTQERFGSKNSAYENLWEDVAWMESSECDAHRWVHQRMRAALDFILGEHPKYTGLDASDAGMAYALLMSDYDGSLKKFSRLAQPYCPGKTSPGQ